MEVAYIRTSSKDQTPQIQLRDIETLIKSKEYAIYREQDSAWAENVSRPEFEKVLDLIRKNKVTHLYVFDLDRIYRNRIRLKDFFLLCKMYGTTVHSYNQSWLEQLNSIPPPFNEIVQELMINMMGWLAEEESGKKSARVKMAIVKKSKGTYSYKGNKWGRKAFPLQTINRVLELNDTGVSIREIAKQVTVYDKNRNERLISKSAVHKIIVENRRENPRLIECT